MSCMESEWALLPVTARRFAVAEVGLCIVAQRTDVTRLDPVLQTPPFSSAALPSTICASAVDHL